MTPAEETPAGMPSGDKKQQEGGSLALALPWLVFGSRRVHLEEAIEEGGFEDREGARLRAQDCCRRG